MNFASMPGGGEPGGEEGMSKLGEVGRVRSWIKARVAVYGDCGVERASCSGMEAPWAGPIRFPFEGGSLEESGFPSGSLDIETYGKVITFISTEAELPSSPSKCCGASVFF